VAQINYDYYEDLSPDSLRGILDNLAAGKEVRPGPQINRQMSAPIGGPTTLTDPAFNAAATGQSGEAAVPAHPARDSSADRQP